MFSLSLSKYPELELLDVYGISMFNIMRNLLTVFPGDCTNLQSYTQYTSVPLSPHHPQHLLFLSFLILAILTGIR